MPKSSWWGALKHAFSLAGMDEPLTGDEEAVLDRIAQAIVRRRLQVMAVLTLESTKPLSYVGSQAMAFFEPVVQALFSATEYSDVRRILEHRQSMELLITKIEQFEGIEGHEARSNVAVSGEEAGR